MKEMYYVFYYSKTQEEEKGYNFVNDKGVWKKYTQLCIYPSIAKGLYKDAVAVLRTDYLPLVKPGSLAVMVKGSMDNPYTVMMDMIKEVLIKKEFKITYMDIKKRIKELNTLIDESLDKKDKESFMKYSKEIKHLHEEE